HPEVASAGADVSSSRFGELLPAGDVEEAKRLLGRAFAVRGRVATGDRRGRTLGFPTVNLAPENEVIPGLGVYAGHVRLLDHGPGALAAGARFPAVTNVGRRPTFKENDPPLAEAHLLDFEGDLYGRRVEVSFEARLRAEQRFPSRGALREQIARDVANGRRLLADDREAPPRPA